jgi:hypothetical protein
MSPPAEPAGRQARQTGGQEQAEETVQFDTSKPHIAPVYDYWLFRPDFSLPCGA